ncbi:MAG TPA: Lrp/AsnC family transcriptional regulator [Desulfotomaculum sp.]|jgi:DNA-binding Lrp family transcriptional regulator|nr:Lrp/AsnC family transcriptional regulator [Desulfotomaculum sp.]
MLDEMDRRLLNVVQTSLPVVAEPYRELAGALDTTEEDIIARLQRLRQAGIIRQLGAIFDSRQMGYKGTLCALKVSPEQIGEVAVLVNSFPGVTHNYLRDHEYNMWFTVLAESQDKLDEIVQEIKGRTGIEDCLLLPAVNVFKIKVNFDLGEE